MVRLVNDTCKKYCQ